MVQKRRLLITSNSFGSYDSEPLELLKKEGWEIITNPLGKILNEEEMMKIVPDVDAIILGSDSLTKNVLEKANKLKVISRYGVGIDNIDQVDAKKRGIIIERTVGANAAAVSDFTVGLMLATLRFIPSVNKDMMQGVWKKRTGMDLYNKKVGIVGLGAIGKGVVERLKGFGCKFIAYDLYPDLEFCQKNHVELVELNELLESSEIISLHIPGNNKPIITDGEIERMKDNVVIINTARATLVDEEALLRGLKSKKIFGYGSDVFSNEPLVPQAFVNSDENIVMSPHMAAVSVGAINNMTENAVENILKHFKEEK